MNKLEQGTRLFNQDSIAYAKTQIEHNAMLDFLKRRPLQETLSSLPPPSIVSVHESWHGGVEPPKVVKISVKAEGSRKGYALFNSPVSDVVAAAGILTGVGYAMDQAQIEWRAIKRGNDPEGAVRSAKGLASMIIHPQIERLDLVARGIEKNQEVSGEVFRAFIKQADWELEYKERFGKNPPKSTEEIPVPPEPEEDESLYFDFQGIKIAKKGMFTAAIFNNEGDTEYHEFKDGVHNVNVIIKCGKCGQDKGACACNMNKENLDHVIPEKAGIHSLENVRKSEQSINDWFPDQVGDDNGSDKRISIKVIWPPQSQERKEQEEIEIIPIWPPSQERPKQGDIYINDDETEGNVFLAPPQGEKVQEGSKKQKYYILPLVV